MKAESMIQVKIIILLASLALLLHSCSKNEATTQEEASAGTRILNAAFVCVDKVYNSELMAPYDILQHTVYRDSSNYIRCFILTPDGKTFRTSEGVTITPHYSFENCPPVDILLIPSTENSMTTDLENSMLMSWLKEKVSTASHVITLCDGAYPLAATGALNNRVATTFPGDRDRLAEMFPDIEVRHDVNFVVDGKFITSVGGALSYEPALYLVEMLYSTAHARRTGQGLVLDWDLQSIPHLIVEK
jgi:transcriptional regulator GlxA family with amidase domain